MYLNGYVNWRKKVRTWQGREVRRRPLQPIGRKWWRGGCSSWTPKRWAGMRFRFSDTAW